MWRGPTPATSSSRGAAARPGRWRVACGELMPGRATRRGERGPGDQRSARSTAERLAGIPAEDLGVDEDVDRLGNGIVVRAPWLPIAGAARGSARAGRASSRRTERPSVVVDQPVLSPAGRRICHRRADANGARERSRAPLSPAGVRSTVDCRSGGEVTDRFRCISHRSRRPRAVRVGHHPPQPFQRSLWTGNRRTHRPRASAR